MEASHDVIHIQRTLTVDMNCGLKVRKVIILKNVTYVHLFLLFQNKFLQKLIINRKKWKIHVKIPLQDTIHTFMIMMWLTKITS